MLINLIQPQELFGPPERQDELRTCWERNAGLFDHYSTPEGRPTFTQLFALCQPGMVNVIANSDIYFDGMGIERLASCDFGAKTCLAISRWDVKADGSTELWDHRDSQDAWVFYDRPDIAADFPMGTGGCDNHLLHLIEQAGYKVINPAKTIKAYHLHLVDYRSYVEGNKGVGRGGVKVDRICPPYAFASPQAI